MVQTRTLFWAIFLVTVISIIIATVNSYEIAPPCEIKTQSNENIFGTSNRGICAYPRISYAEPPVGRMRFEKPCPVLHLTSRHGSEINGLCPQLDKENSTLIGDENCLFLNVFTKWGEWGEPPQNRTLLPVLVWIHGGSFAIGSGLSDNFNPNAFVDEGIVVVSFNYRLSVFGFMPMAPNGEYTQNVGLDDQRVALLWIQRHIHQFGGDPSRVTIMGWGAGAASVNYLMYDKNAKELFHSAIAMSGSFNSPWAFNRRPQKTRQDICARESKSCSIRGLNELLDGKENAQHLMLEYVADFVPSFYRHHKDDPESQMMNGVVNDVPLLMGVTNDELHNFGSTDFSQLEKNLMNFYDDPNEKELQRVLKMLRTSRDDSPEEFHQHVAMVEMYYGVYKFMELHAKTSRKDLYFYQLNYDPENGTTGHVGHQSTINLLFDSYKRNSWQNRNVAKFMKRTWVDFIKYQDPFRNEKNFRQNFSIPTGALNLIRVDKYRNVSSQLTQSSFYRVWDDIVQCLNYRNCPKHQGSGSEMRIAGTFLLLSLLTILRITV